MARGKDLAALAGLAGLAYAMRNKDKDEAPKGKEDTGPGYKSTETREEPRRQITDYMKKAPLDGTEMYPPRVMGGATQAAPELAPVVKPEPKPAPANPAVAANNATEDSQSSLKAPITSAARSDQLASLSRAIKREDMTKKAAQSGSSDKSAFKTDALATASRAAAAADRQRRIVGAGGMKKGGSVKKMASGGSTASKRADGIASKGKTKCKMY